MTSGEFSAPTPALEPAFSMTLEFAADIDVGAIATGGRRIAREVAGGAFAGRGLAGDVIGGSELVLERADGVAELEVAYYLSVGGQSVRCFGKGYLTQKPFAGTRLSLTFEAAQGGDLSGLATRMYLGERPIGSATLTVVEIA